jgi:hypothetical protein
MKLLLERWQAYLEEGKADDIIAKYPNLKPAFDAGIKKPQQLNWMAKRLGDTSIEDAVDAIKAFDKAKAALKSKKKNTDIYGYKTVQDLKDIVSSIGPSRSQKDTKLEKERILVGEFGDWKVELPLTTQSACHIGKGTTWCTAATKTKNMFLHYTEQGVILFHITERGVDPTEDAMAKLTVGFIDGKPVLEGKTGGVTVNARNEGLTIADLLNLFQRQYSPIMDAMQAQVDKLGGVHPAMGEKEERIRKQKEEILNGAERAAKDLELHREFYERIQTMVPELRIDYLEKLFASEPVPEVVESFIEMALDGRMAEIQYLSRYARADAIERIFAKSKEMNKDINADFAVLLSRNPYISGESLARLTKIPAFRLERRQHVRQRVIYNVLSNDKLPLEVALKFLNKYLAVEQGRLRFDSRRGGMVAPTGAMQAEAQTVIEYIASRKDLPPEVLERLSNSNSAPVLADVASNVNTPPDVLIKLAGERVFMVKMAVAKNPSSPAKALTKMFKEIAMAGRDTGRDQRLLNAIKAHPNYAKFSVMAPMAMSLGGELAKRKFRKLFREELEAVLRERNRRER